MTAGRFRAVFRRRVWLPLVTLFTQGTSPREIALCIAIGAAVGVFPVPGTTSVLCTLVALRLRLNQGAIHAVNWLVFGPHFVLILPFLRIGETLFRVPPLPLSVEALKDAWSAQGWSFALNFWRVIGCAIGGWGVTAVPIAIALYFAMRAIFHRWRPKFGGSWRVRDGL